MLEDFRLTVFAEIVSEGSFTKAARKLGITQPAASQNIGELEKILGGDLFTRNSHGPVTLTEKGIEFKRYADQILYWYKAAEDVFLNEGSHISAPATVKLDENTSLEIYSSQGDIHIQLKK